MHQQLFSERFKGFRQLRKKHPEVFQHFVTRQRFTRLLSTNTRTIDQVQLTVVTQQVVQM